MNRFARLAGLLRGLLVAAGLIVIWQIVVWITEVPRFILPGPAIVLDAMVRNAPLLASHTLTTGTEILLGLVIGTALGCISAIVMDFAATLRRWIMPVLVVCQAVPVFALAPLLVLWLGFGMASKVAMATLIIYFPVTTTFLGGLRRTEPGWMDLARSMDASRWQALWHIRVPAALPSLASGLRVATAVAPIGAVIGEWVGSSSGLGHQMLLANGRGQTDLMFAALAVLAGLAITLFFTMDHILARALPWLQETGSGTTLRQ